MVALVSSSVAVAQQIRFPESSATVSNPWNPPINGVTSPSYGTAPSWPTTPPLTTPMSSATSPAMTSVPTYPAPPSSSSLGLRPNTAPILPTQTPTWGTGSGWNLGSWLGTGTYSPVPTYAPTYAPNMAPSSGYFPNSYPPSVYPSTVPPTLFPGGYSSIPSYPVAPNGGQGSLYPNSTFSSNPWPTGNGWFGGNPNGPLWTGNIPMPTRFFVTPRFRHSWIAGDDQSTSVGVNDSDLSGVFQIPGFLGSTQPLYIVPSFSLHLWDGPDHPSADLPANAYSAFLDFGWESNPLRTFGTELGVRVGAFTDFDTFNSESLRVLGKIIGRVRLTPNSTFRLGAYWIDRNRIKLIPAAGILWSPNNDTRFDIFFPEPKLSHYVATVGRSDMWWYVSGYYGGGAWTIQRADGSSDNVDLNDIRVVLGLEWGRNELLRQGHRTAFLEGGYVFNRELIYRISPLDNIDVENSFVLRAGFVY